MTANEFLTAIAQVSGLLAIVGSVLAMGMSLTVSDRTTLAKCASGRAGSRKGQWWRSRDRHHDPQLLR